MAMQNLKTSEIATKFNLQHPNESVTQQAVHKWLNGLAIPSMDKIEQYLSGYQLNQNGYVMVWMIMKK